MTTTQRTNLNPASPSLFIVTERSRTGSSDIATFKTRQDAQTFADAMASVVNGCSYEVTRIDNPAFKAC